MRTLIITILAALTAIPAFAAEEPKQVDPNTFYAIGLGLSKQISTFNLTPAELDQVKQGLTDGITGTTPRVSLDDYHKKIQELFASRRDAMGEKLAASTKEFLDKAAKEKGAIKTRSGLVFLSLKEGTGAGPAATDKVKVNYRGMFIDGKEFENSYRRGQPNEFAMNKVMPCLAEGVAMMKAGGKARLVCPPDLAYGERGYGPVPANATLVYEVELLDVIK
jgi:FKBP-type peptidyl-prolyl cis-trans isomerase FkpA